MVDLKPQRIASILVLALAIAGCAAPRRAQAQFIGYTSSQSTTSIPFNNVTCTAALAAGDVLVTNIGQGAHQLVLTGNSGLTALSYVLQGSFDGTTFFDISDTGTLETFGNITGLTGSQYYPVIAAKVNNCGPGSGTLSLKYTGISMTPGLNYGANLLGQTAKNIENGGPANTSIAPTIRTPFASSGGVLSFSYIGTGPSGSTLSVSCATGFTISIFGTFPLITTSGVPQTFVIPAMPCPFATVSFNSGGASAATYSLDYVFSVPGQTSPAYQYAHITGTTAVPIKTTSGFLHTLVINLGAAGTVSFFDLPVASCTGTPATNQVAIVTATATSLQALTYDVNFIQGICLKTSVAMDLTVSYQ